MLGSTTWWHGGALDDAMAGAGLVAEGRFGSPSGDVHDEDGELETIVFRRA